MKRSEINAILEESKDFMESYNWSLPEWATWSPGDWEGRLEDCGRILERSLGWDITDFGSGDFRKRGLFLFTLRNGIFGRGDKVYAEKIMIVGENQETPYHFHWNKMEDIINRGGGELMFQLYKADEKEEFSDESFDIYIDDRRLRVDAGEYVCLKPGQSLCLEPYVYHRFFAAEGTGSVLTGEVSMVNDDAGDNRFYESLGRFPEIDEDQQILHYLVCDYPRLKERV